MLEFEAALAAALVLRGVDVHAIICDGALQACIRREINNRNSVGDWARECGACRVQTSAVLEKFGISHDFIGDYISDSTRQKLWQQTEGITWETLDDLNLDGIDLARNIRSSFTRYLQGEDMDCQRNIIREYAYAALVSNEASIKALEKHKPSGIFSSTATYVDWGPMWQRAIASNIPIAGWMSAYMKGRFYLRWVDDFRRTAFHIISDQRWADIKKRPLSGEEESILAKYIESRYQTSRSADLVVLNKYSGNAEHLRAKYRLDSKKPIWTLFAHLTWDPMVDYSPMAYDSFEQWIRYSISEMIKIPDVQWLIKIHPAELWCKPVQGVAGMIRKWFPHLPEHVKVIPASDQPNPYDFFQLIDGGVTVFGTSGLELSLMGKPVIVCGEAYYAKKGFTYDAFKPEDSHDLLRQVPNLKPLEKHQIQLAQRFAYAYFIQRQIPLAVMKHPTSHMWAFQYEKMECLVPGKDPFVDFVCDCLMNGKEFIMSDALTRESNNLGW